MRYAYASQEEARRDAGELIARLWGETRTSGKSDVVMEGEVWNASQKRQRSVASDSESEKKELEKPRTQ